MGTLTALRAGGFWERFVCCGVPEMQPFAVFWLWERSFWFFFGSPALNLCFCLWIAVRSEISQFKARCCSAALVLGWGFEFPRKEHVLYFEKTVTREAKWMQILAVCWHWKRFPVSSLDSCKHDSCKSFQLKDKLLWTDTVRPDW